MKRVIWLSIFLLPALTCNLMASTYYISTTGSDPSGAGTYGNPWATSTKAFSSMVGNDWLIKKYGLYTSTGNGSGACITIIANTFPAHSSQTIVIAGELPFGTIDWATGTVINQGCSTAFDISFTSYIAIQDQYVVNSGRAGQIWDCNNSKISFKRIGVKNGSNYAETYGNVFDIGSGNGGTKVNSSDILFEDVWIAGSARYMIVNGGAQVYSEHNLFRRVVLRSDGNNGTQPKGGIAMYGPTGAILGARNSHVQQSIALNFNNSSFFPGEDTYGGFYCPWAPTGITFRDCIVMNMGNGWRGFALGEGSATNNEVINSVSWRAGKQGVRLTGASNSSMTVVGSLLAYSTDTAEGYGYNAAVDIRRSLVERNALQSAGATNDDFNAYESTVNPPASTNEVLGIHTITYITSMTDTNIISNGIGPTIIRKLGTDGTFWNETGWATYQSGNLWPYPYEGHIKALFAKADTGDAATNNSANNTTRGWAGTTLTLSSYVWSAAGFACPAEICAPAACNSTTLSPSFTGSTPSSFTVTYTSAAASSYLVVMSSNSDFSAPRSSGSILPNTTTYVNLTEGVTYYFEVKIATEADCGYSAAISTAWVPSPGSAAESSPQAPATFQRGNGMLQGNFIRKSELWREQDKRLWYIKPEFYENGSVRRC